MLSHCPKKHPVDNSSVIPHTLKKRRRETFVLCSVGSRRNSYCRTPQFGANGLRMSSLVTNFNGKPVNGRNSAKPLLMGHRSFSVSSVQMRTAKHKIRAQSMSAKTVVSKQCASGGTGVILVSFGMLGKPPNRCLTSATVWLNKKPTQ